MVPPKPPPSLQRVVQVGLQLNGSRWGELMDTYFAQYSGHSSQPASEADLAKIGGVRVANVRRYGQELIELIRKV